MKDIKFRFTFLTKNSKSYIVSIDKTLDEILDSSFALEEMEEYINSEAGIYDIEDYPEYECIKRQCADWKDKQNIEIYEGDIIQMYSHSFDTHKHEKDTRTQYKAKVGELSHYEYIGDINDIRIVEHRYGTLGLYGENGSGGIFTHFSNLNRPGQSIEVIGNIYKNSELLICNRS